MHFDHLKRLLVFILLLSNYPLLAQEKYTVSGYLKDKQNGEALIGVTVILTESKTGTTTNVYGFYSLTLPAGPHTLAISYIGYKTITKEINLISNLNLDFELSGDDVELQEVIVSDTREDENIQSVEMSSAKVDIKQIQRIPALLGEVDIIRSIQLLPGVTTVGEGATGFNVRGGSIDQNLILLDEAPVYNSAHALGFFSVFNPDVVKDVKLLKGGIPANYGGRISSLLDVRLKEGNSKNYEVKGGVGIIFSRLSVEGPILKNKASFIVAGRRSYVDAFFPFTNNDVLKETSVYFYDFTAKANWTINSKNKLFISGFFGRDQLGNGSFGFNWGNTTTSLRWNHLFNNKLFLNLTAYYSNYDYRLGGTTRGNSGFNWRSEIVNYSVKSDFTYYINPKNTLSFGAQSIYYQFIPAKATFQSGGQTNTLNLPDKYSLESALYIANEQQIGNRITLNYGLRLSYFNFMGKSEAVSYGEAPAGLRRPVTERKTYDAWKNITDYTNLEPRFAIKYLINDRSSLKFSYNRMAQYIHLVSNSTASVPLDVWTPSTNNIKPQIGDQVALGYFRNFGKGNAFEFSVETYYKEIQNQIDYIDNADLLFNTSLEGDLLKGRGRAYGLEVYLKKNTGKLTGWMSYTLARTETQVNGINQNKWYPSRFDKTHNLYVVGSYEISKRITLSANFVISSGTPATFPTNRIEFEGLVIPQNANDQRNNYRIPTYHRLDLSIIIEGKNNDKHRWKSQWVISLYNVYGNRNPFSIYFRQNKENASITEAVRYSVIPSIIPGITYNFKF